MTDAVKTDPFLGEARYRLAAAYLGAGRGDSALAMLQTSLRLGYVGAPETYLAVGTSRSSRGAASPPALGYLGQSTEAVWDPFRDDPEASPDRGHRGCRISLLYMHRVRRLA